MRRLRLSKETLDELSTHDLAAIAGGDGPTGDCQTFPLLQCLSFECFWYTRAECT